MPSLRSIKTDEASFRTYWNFDSQTPEYLVFSYLESLGQSKRVLVVEALLNYYYPDLAYRSGDLNAEQKALIHRQISALESRADYFRRLIGYSSQSNTPAVRAVAPPPPPPAVVQTAIESVAPQPEEEEEEYLYDEDGI